MSTSTRETVRQTLRASTVRDTVLRSGGGGVIPAFPDHVLVDRNGDYLVDRSGSYMVGRPIWTYADIATAESSGDPWKNGDTIVITGGPVMLYQAALAVNGYSGLIHAHPYDGTGELGALASSAARAYTEIGSDPNDWANAVDTSQGTEGVDYAFDTESGRSRMRTIGAIGQSKRCTLQGAAGTIDNTDNECFMILEGISVGGNNAESVAQNLTYAQVYCLRDPAEGEGGNLIGLVWRSNSNNWTVLYGRDAAYVTTTKSVAAERRAYLYVKNGWFAVWFDGDAVPEISGSLPRAVAGSGGWLFQENEYTYSNNIKQLLSQMVMGSMVTTAQQASPPWIYDSLGEAEASGHPWQDGDDIEITGGPTFVYQADLAVNGYSGLIHKYPYDGTGTLGSLDSIDVKNSSLQSVDPDDWTNVTKTSISLGGGGISDGRSQLFCPSTNDRVTYTSDTVPASDELEAFGIFDKISAFKTGIDSTGGDPYVDNVVGVYYDGTGNFIRGISLAWRWLTSVPYWSLRTATNTYTVTTKTVAAERRAWLYVKNGRWALWFDDDATPELSGTTTWTTTDTGGKHSRVRQKSLSSTTFTDQTLKQYLTGIMETS
jgi:hypothetical protein